MSISVEQYNPEWPQRFEILKAQLEGYLQDTPYLSIEHVGSTSVRDLAAKPIIDIDIVVNREHLQSVTSALITKGKCDHLGELGVTDRHVFKNPDQAIVHNVYVCIHDSPSLRNHLALRDTLRANASLRDEYAALKLSLATTSTSMIDYTRAKGTLCQKILLASGKLTPSELSAIAASNAHGTAFSALLTLRLLLREFTTNDIPAYFALESNPANARYQSWPPRTLAESRTLVLAAMRAHNDNPRTLYELAVETLPPASRFLGRVGAQLRSSNSDHLPGERTIKHVTHVDLWFSLVPEAQGHGYATEAVARLVAALGERVQREEEGKMELQIACDPRNERSWKVAERLGFERFELVRGAWECKGEWVDNLVYRKVVGDGVEGGSHVRSGSMSEMDGRDAVAAAQYAPKGTGQS
ncbi:hypothetical protein ACN47E_007399 [Coniothyrium glycines]